MSGDHGAAVVRFFWTWLPTDFPALIAEFDKNAKDAGLDVGLRRESSEMEPRFSEFPYAEYAVSFLHHGAPDIALPKLRFSVMPNCTLHAEIPGTSGGVVVLSLQGAFPVQQVRQLVDKLLQETRSVCP